MNTLMYDPVKNYLIDPTGWGAYDAINKNLRIILGSPGNKDAWHFIRCIKFMGRGYQIDDNSRTRLVKGFEAEYGANVYNKTKDTDYKLSLLAGSLSRICKATVDGPIKAVELQTLVAEWYDKVFLTQLKLNKVSEETQKLYSQTKKSALIEALVMARYRKFPEHHSYTAPIIHSAELMDNLLGNNYHLFPSHQGLQPTDWSITNLCLNVYFRVVSHFPSDWVHITHSLKRYLEQLDGQVPRLPDFCRQETLALYEKLDFKKHDKVSSNAKKLLENSRILQSSLMRHICAYINNFEDDKEQLKRVKQVLEDYEYVRKKIKNQDRWLGLVNLLGYESRDKLDELVMFGGEIKDMNAKKENDAITLNLDLFNQISKIGAHLDNQLQTVALDSVTGRLKVKVFNMESYISIEEYKTYVAKYLTN